MEPIQVPDVGLLRLPQAADVKELFEIIQANQKHLIEWQDWIEQIRSRAHLQYFIDTNRRDAEKFYDAVHSKELTSSVPGFQMLLVDTESSILGMVGYQGINLRNKICSIGYWLAKQHQGQGYITKACRAVVDYSFDTLGFNRIEIQSSVENERSQGIPERLGFTKEAKLAQIEYKKKENRYVDHYLYRLLRDEWKDRG